MYRNLFAHFGFGPRSFANKFVAKSTFCFIKTLSKFPKKVLLLLSRSSLSFGLGTIEKPEGLHSIELFSLLPYTDYFKLFYLISLTNGIYNFLTFYHLPENGVFSVQPWSLL